MTTAIRGNVCRSYRALSAAVIRCAFVDSGVPSLVANQEKLIAHLETGRGRSGRKGKALLRRVSDSEKKVHGEFGLEARRWLLMQDGPGSELKTFAGLLGHGPTFYAHQMQNLLRRAGDLRAVLASMTEQKAPR